MKRIILHQNIQFLRNKTLEVESLVDRLVNKPHILLFSEHWMKPKESQFVKLSGYELVSCYSRLHMEHGVYASVSLNLQDEKTIVEKSIEVEIEIACAVQKELSIIVCLPKRTRLIRYIFRYIRFDA